MPLGQIFSSQDFILRTTLSAENQNRQLWALGAKLQGLFALVPFGVPFYTKTRNGREATGETHNLAPSSSKIIIGSSYGGISRMSRMVIYPCLAVSRDGNKISSVIPGPYTVPSECSSRSESTIRTPAFFQVGRIIVRMSNNIQKPIADW